VTAHQQHLIGQLVLRMQRSATALQSKFWTHCSKLWGVQPRVRRHTVVQMAASSSSKRLWVSWNTHSRFGYYNLHCFIAKLQVVMTSRLHALQTTASCSLVYSNYKRSKSAQGAAVEICAHIFVRLRAIVYPGGWSRQASLVFSPVYMSVAEVGMVSRCISS
jgi:hypothetical protein